MRHAETSERKTFKEQLDTRKMVASESKSAESRRSCSDGGLVGSKVDSLDTTSTRLKNEVRN